MKNSVNEYRKRRSARIKEKSPFRMDAVDAYRERRLLRMQARFDANPQIAYGIAQGMGIDTEGMSPYEVWEAIRKKNPGGLGKNTPRNKKNTNLKSGKNQPSHRESIKGVTPKMAKEAGYVGGWVPPQMEGMDDADVHKSLTACHKIGGKHYENGTKMANMDNKRFLRTFTTHGLDHVQQVVEKTNQAADEIDKIVGNERFIREPIDRKLMLYSAWFHDTGMDGGLHPDEFENDNGNGVREAHGVNSALHILEHADELRKQGVNPNQAAFIAFAHTKSKSGINDLTDVKDWEIGLKTLSDAAEKSGIKFDANEVFGGKPTKKNIGQMAAQVAALRLGDANREANIPLRSQTGGEYTVKGRPKVEQCKGLKEEEDASDISITLDGKEHVLGPEDEYFEGVKYKFSKHVVLGERNMVAIDTHFNKKHNSLQLNVDLDGGNEVPWSTTEALLERCGELNTINGVPGALKISMTGLKSADDMNENTINAFMTMWNTIQTKKIKDGRHKGELSYKGIGDVVLEFENGDKLSLAKTLGDISSFELSEDKTEWIDKRKLKNYN